MVARTEMAQSQNLGTVARYRESGIVQAVQIVDGDGCGWTSHNDGDIADGTIRSLSDFEAWPTSHPNCIRSASPVLGDL